MLKALPDKSERRAIAYRVLSRFLDDPSVLGGAIKRQQWLELACASELAEEGLPDELRDSDPEQYERMRRALEAFRAEGYHVLDHHHLLDLVNRKIIRESNGGAA